MTYFYLKPYTEPEKYVLHMFACTEVFEEMQKTFYTLSVLAENDPHFSSALEEMTITYS